MILCNQRKIFSAHYATWALGLIFTCLPFQASRSMEELRAAALASMTATEQTTPTLEQGAAPTLEQRSLEELRAAALASMTTTEQTTPTRRRRARSINVNVTAPLPTRRRIHASTRTTEEQQTALPIKHLTDQQAARIRAFLIGKANEALNHEQIEIAHDPADAQHLNSLGGPNTSIYFSSISELKKVLVPCATSATPQRYIPFIHYLIWGGCYKPNDLKNMYVTPSNHAEQRVEDQVFYILKYLNALNALESFVDNNGMSAGLLLVHAGYLSTLEEAPVKTLYAPLTGKKGCILLQLIRVHFGNIPVRDYAEVNCEPLSNLRARPYAYSAYTTTKQKIEQIILVQSQAITQKMSAGGKKLAPLLTDTGDTNFTHWLVQQAAKASLFAATPSIGTTETDKTIALKPQLLFAQTACGQTPLQLAVQSSNSVLVKNILTHMVHYLRERFEHWETLTEERRLQTQLLLGKLYTQIPNLQSTYKSRTPLHWLFRNAIGSLEKQARLASLTETTKVALMLRLLGPDTMLLDANNCSPVNIARTSAVAILQKTARNARYSLSTPPRRCAHQGYTFNERRIKHAPSQALEAQLANTIANNEALQDYTPDELLGYILSVQYFLLLPGLNDLYIKQQLLGQSTPVAFDIRFFNENQHAAIQYLNETLQCLEKINQAIQWQELTSALKPSSPQQFRRLQTIPKMIPVLMDTFNIIIPHLNTVR